MTGYINLEEQRKAAKVRKLVNTTNKIVSNPDNYENGYMKENIKENLWDTENKFFRLSNQLATYLRTNYPNNFKIHEFDIPEEVRLTNLEQLHNIFKQVNDSINIHDIAILYPPRRARGIYILFKDSDGNYEYVYEFRKSTLMPKEFYKFLEEMGLTTNAAGKLYNIIDFGNRYFIEFPDMWPRTIAGTNKIL
jgi:hypothetical protein